MHLYTKIGYGRFDVVYCVGSPFTQVGFWWTKHPQTMLQAPPNLNMKHYKSVEFCQFLLCQAPLHKRKALLLKTF